jgi:hypothetical protein
MMRLPIISLALAAQLISCHAETFYVALKNVVYTTEARELPWNDASTLPLALRGYDHHVRILVVYQKDQRKITEIDSSKLPNLFHVPNLKFDSLLINRGRVYQKFGPLRLFKQYPTDAYDRNVDVTAFPRHNRIFVAVAPTQKNPFEGSTCIITDVTTKQDIHVAHRISEVYPSLEPEFTWISDTTVLAFEYTWRGSGGYYIKTRNDSRTPGWEAVRNAQYFSFNGSHLTLYIPNGPHFDPEVVTNFVGDLSFPLTNCPLAFADARGGCDLLAFQPLN